MTGSPPGALGDQAVCNLWRSLGRHLPLTAFEFFFFFDLAQGSVAGFLPTSLTAAFLSTNDYEALR